MTVCVCILTISLLHTIDGWFGEQFDEKFEWIFWLSYEQLFEHSSKELKYSVLLGIGAKLRGYPKKRSLKSVNHLELISQFFFESMYVVAMEINWRGARYLASAPRGWGSLSCTKQ